MESNFESILSESHALQIFVYYDDAEVVNPSATIRKLGKNVMVLHWVLSYSYLTQAFSTFLWETYHLIYVHL